MPVEALKRFGQEGEEAITGASAATFCKRVLFEDTVEGGGNIAQVDADFVADMHCHDPGCHQGRYQVFVIAFS